VKEGVTDQLVYRIVTTDIFMEGFEAASRIEEGGGVQSSRSVKNGLAEAKSLRQPVEESGLKGCR
jgi:hypothetical protein